MINILSVFLGGTCAAPVPGNTLSMPLSADASLLTSALDTVDIGIAILAGAELSHVYSNQGYSQLVARIGPAGQLVSQLFSGGARETC